MKLESLFDVRNGVATAGLTILPEPAEEAIPFLRPASTQERTLAGWVKRNSLPVGKVFPGETIFVSTNGEGSHTYAYVSSFEFACNSDVSVLVPFEPMGLPEKIYYARCITLNRFRFSYGRKPKGQRLKSIELPESSPAWVTAAAAGIPVWAEGALARVVANAKFGVRSEL